MASDLDKGTFGLVESPKAPDQAKPDTTTEPRQGMVIETTVHERLTRGQQRLAQIAPEANLCWENWRGNHYWYVNDKGILSRQVSGPASIRSAGKPSWRVRESHNLLLDFVAHLVSRASARTPSYEVVPTTGDPEDYSAAKLAEKVALYGHDKWSIRRAAIKGFTHAIVTGEAFAWVYWDSSIGPFIEGTDVGLGDICVEIYGKTQVYWEPGQEFEASKWHAVDIAMTPQGVKQLDGYIGPDRLACDADIMSYANRGHNNSRDRKMVLVTYYLERPSPAHPLGRWKTYANQLEITEQRDYPGDGAKPCLHRLSYTIDPDSDRDHGLVAPMLPAMRQYDDASNKIDEWKNLHMMGGRVYITPGLLQGQQLTDEPGQVIQIMQPNENVKVQEAPSIPPELFRIREDALAEMGRIAGQNDLPSQVESGKGMIAFADRDEGRQHSFHQCVAEWYSNIMRSALQLVQKYYTEERVIAIKGSFGWESIADFMGAHLADNLDVRVNPSSFEPLTRAQVEARVIAYADRLWIPPDVAMKAIQTGTAENLLGDIERAEARVHRVIRRIKEGTAFDMPERTVPAPPDPITGQRIDPITGMPSMQVPGWMPLPWDNLRMWRSIFESWFSTEEAETLDEPTQVAANLIYQQVLLLEEQEAMMQQQRQMAMASQLGLDNAAAPQGPATMPDMPKLGTSETMGGPTGLATPNQPRSQNTPS